MNLSSRFILILAMVLALGARGLAEEKPTAAAAPIMLVNFTAVVPGVYGYSTWKDCFAIAPNAGFRIQGSKGAQGDGGFCQTLNPALDLSKCIYVEIALSVQAGNEVPEYTIALGDADGTQCSARVRVAQLMPGQPVWLRLKVSDFAVSSRDPGTDGKIDWSKIAQWHLQGDWVTKKPSQILFIALRARA